MNGWRNLLAALILVAGARPALADTIVFAAASTAGPVQEIIGLYNAKGGAGLAKASFAASSILAKQIENGAPASIFISAHPEWMDFLEKAKAIDPSSRFDLAGNRLALIVPAMRAETIEIAPLFPLASMLGEGRLAMGDPDHVPAGIYGKAALESLGVFEAVSRRLLRTEDARAALVMVERGEAVAGIVFSSDAAISKRVRVAGVFPGNSHPPIIYEAALTAGKGDPLAMDFFNLLKSSEAKGVFAKHGFVAINRPMQ